MHIYRRKQSLPSQSLSAPLLIFFLTLTTLASIPTSGQSQNASIAVLDRDGRILIDNQLTRIRLDKRSGNLDLIQTFVNNEWLTLAANRKAMYFDANTSRYVNPTVNPDIQITRPNDSSVQITVKGSTQSAFPFQTTVYYRVHAGLRGFYTWVVYRHTEDAPRGSLGQTRFVIRTLPRTQRFTHHVIDRQLKLAPTSPMRRKVSDATYELQDDSVYTKYDNTVYEHEHQFHGAIGKQAGIYFIYPSNEFLGGGPFKQNLTIHMDDDMADHVILGMLQSGHYNSGGIRVDGNESWEKVFGPLLVYINHKNSVEQMHRDASARAQAERANWPYQWMKHPAYPIERGKVTGSVIRWDGRDPAGGWAVLVPTGDNWMKVSKGYHFWSAIDSNGTFSIDKIRPGQYTLILAGAESFDDSQHTNITVKPNETTDLGQLSWAPETFGQTVWQIGKADRTSHEFKDGDNYRNFQNYKRYPAAFPNDVTFTVGESKANQDWNYAHWSIYKNNPAWTIRFKMQPTSDQSTPTNTINTIPASGQARLTIGFTAAHPPRGRRTQLQVAVNGQPVETITLARTGTAGYRSGSMDSKYNVRRIEFDTALLEPGMNEITLQHLDAKKIDDSGRWARGVGHVMYDALRLEIKPNKKPKGE